MDKIVIRPMDDLLTRFGNQLGAIGEGDARKVLARAVNRTAAMAKTRVVRELAKQSSIPVALVRKAVRITKAAHKGNGPIEAVIHSTGRPLSLIHFKPRQFTWGVRAKVKGEFKRYKGDFINAGRWNSGNPAFGGHVMYREGKARFPVKRALGPAIPDEMIIGASAMAFAEVVNTALPRRVAHELGRILNP